MRLGKYQNVGNFIHLWVPETYGHWSLCTMYIPDISGTGLKLLPLGLLQLSQLTNLTAAGLNLNCDCQTTLRLVSLLTKVILIVPI